MKKNQSKALIDVKIEDELFQTLVAFTLTKIKGVSLPPVGLIDTLFAKSVNHIKFVEITRDDSAMSVEITITAKVEMGVEIPQKAKEIQKLVREEVEKSTGYSVASVYIIFNSIEEKIAKKRTKEALQLESYLDS